MSRGDEHGAPLAQGKSTTYNLGDQFLIYSASATKDNSDVARNGKKYGYYLYEGEDLVGDESLKKGDRVTVKEILLNPLLNPQTRELPQGLRKQIRQEIVLQAEIRHRNLVQVHYSCVTPTKVFIIRDRIEGESLASICAERRDDAPALSFHEAGSYFNQLVNAVSFLHSQCVCHRGLTSDNCIVDKSGCLKIQDFGLAIVAQEGMCVTLCGSPLFWPPEMRERQVGQLGTAYNGAAMDVWSLGMILHLLLAGKVPQDLKKNKREGESGPVLLFLDDIHPENDQMDAESAKDLIKRMLDPDPRTRITIEGVVQHLRERPWCDIPYEETSGSVVAWEGERNLVLKCEPMPGLWLPLSLFELVGTVSPVCLSHAFGSRARQARDLTDIVVLNMSKYQVWRRLSKWEDLTKMGACDNLGIRLKLRQWEDIKIHMRLCEVPVRGERRVRTVISIKTTSEQEGTFREIVAKIRHELGCDDIAEAARDGHMFERFWGEYPEVGEEAQKS